MSSAILWLIVLGITGTLLSSFAAILASMMENKERRNRIHIVPSDDIIASPSEVDVQVFRIY